MQHLQDIISRPLLKNTLSDFEPAPNNLPVVKGLAVVDVSACIDKRSSFFPSCLFYSVHFLPAVNIYLQSPVESKLL